MMLEWSRKYRNILYALLATIIVGLPLVFINSRIAFTRPTNPTWHEISIILKISYLFVFFISTYLLIVFFKAWKTGARLYRQWLSYFLVYFGIMLVLFIVLYPGHWIGDEFNILQSVKIFEPFAWQHYFTNIFYTYSLLTIPTGPAIVFFQITIISVIVGYLLARIKELSKNKRAPTIAFCVFLLPPVIINNFYPLRLTLYSYFSVLLLFEIFRIHQKKYRVKQPLSYIIGVSFLITILSFWRTEGILYLLFLPYLAYKLNFFRIKPFSLSLRGALSLMVCCIIVLTGYFISRNTYYIKYDITVFANPLSQMLQEPLRGSEIKQKLAIIDKVVNIEMFKKHPSATEIPAFWLPGGVRESTYAQYLLEAKKAFAYVVAYNPDLFLKAKIKTFLSANGWSGSPPPQTEGLLAFETLTDPLYKRMVNTFHSNNIASGTINKPLKQFVTRTLLFQHNNRMHWLGYPFWSIIIPILILASLSVYRLRKKQYLVALLGGLLLVSATLIFLSAPANYFMYYLPIYLNAYFMLIVAIYIRSGEAHGE